MTTAPALPATRDEDWRYADIPALATLPAEAWDSWSVLEVPEQGHESRSLLLTGAVPQVSRLRIALGAGARGQVFLVNAADAYSRFEVDVTLGEGAHFELGGVTIGGGAAVREIVSRVRHVAPGATSHQVVRAVHWGEATGNFLGRIEVAREGQQTDAAQDFKGLLLTRGASANARPELEIFADDVKCAHGAAIGQLDEMARFYMAARGIAPDAAKALLVQAFIADALAALDEEAERERLFAAALASLDGAAI